MPEKTTVAINLYARMKDREKCNDPNEFRYRCSWFPQKNKWILNKN